MSGRLPSTHLTHYEYLVMAFGLTNAPAIFQALVYNVLKDMWNQFVFVYLDILFFSSDLQSHQYVRLVLQRLLQLHLRAKKWEFHATSLLFFGYIVSQVKMDLEKVRLSRTCPDQHTTNRYHIFWVLLILLDIYKQLQLGSHTSS